jgi:hypothetical protein
MIEHGSTISGDPRITLERSRTKAQSKPKRLHGVVRSKRTGAAVGETDRWTGGGESSHEKILHQFFSQ